MLLLKNRNIGVVLIVLIFVQCTIDQNDIDKLSLISGFNIHNVLAANSNSFIISGKKVEDGDSIRFHIVHYNFIKYLVEYRNDSLISYYSNDNRQKEHNIN